MVGAAVGVIRFDHGRLSCTGRARTWMLATIVFGVGDK